MVSLTQWDGDLIKSNWHSICMEGYLGTFVFSEILESLMRLHEELFHLPIRAKRVSVDGSYKFYVDVTLVLMKRYGSLKSLSRTTMCLVPLE